MKDLGELKNTDSIDIDSIFARLSNFDRMVILNNYCHLCGGSQKKEKCYCSLLDI